jgi:hypothetical protein
MMHDTLTVVKAALAGNRKLKIYGYRNSKGEVKDLEVELIGAAGYRELVRQSLAAAGDLAINANHEYTHGQFIQAVDEQRLSWTITLQGHEPSPDAGFGWSVPMDRPNALKLDYLKRLGEPGDLTELPKSPVAIAKKRLQHALPIGRFIGSVILEPGKFERVELIPDVPAATKLAFADFQDAVLRWEAPCEVVRGRMDDRAIRLVHAALGLTSEIVELTESDSQVNAIGEVGDMFWFTGCGLRALGQKFRTAEFYANVQLPSGAVDRDTIQAALIIHCGHFADHVKAVAFYGKTDFKGLPANQQLEIDLMFITTLLVKYCRVVLQLDPEVVLAANQAKLAARNAGKATFNRDATLARDTVHEDRMMAAAAGVKEPVLAAT